MYVHYLRLLARLFSPAIAVAVTVADFGAWRSRRLRALLSRLRVWYTR